MVENAKTQTAARHAAHCAGPDRTGDVHGKAIARCARSLRLETAAATDLLRVMISKSLNFTFSVTLGEG